MADSKPRHYASQLDKALTAGAWADSSPATNPGGTAIPWAELVRKWEKHVGGSAGSLALSLRTLSLYLRPTSSSPADGRSSSSPASAPPLASADTPSSTVSQAPAGSSSTHRVHRPHLHTQHPTPASFVPATNITARDLDGDDRSGHPTSLSRGDAWSRCRVPDDRISDVEDGLKEVSELLAKSKTPGEKDSALLLQAFHLLALGRYNEALAVSSQVNWATAAPTSTAKLAAGSTSEAAIVERVRGRVVQGLCYELSTPPNPTAALASYTSAVHTLETLQTLSLPFPSSEKPTTSHTSQSTTNILKEFTSHRELWRWAENALFRGSLLAAASGSAGEGLQWLRTYHFYETVLPPSFRPERRSAILLLYVRALALERPAASLGSAQPTTPVMPAASSSGLVSRSRGTSSPLTWAKETEGVMRRGMAILEAGGTRAFPKAGERRHEVEEFVVGCVGLWERGGGKRGSEASAVLKLLWWATTQTFNSQPVLRHLTRLLLASGSPTDARRTFELYVKIVDKARETADSPATPTPAIASNGNSSGEAAEPVEAEPVESDDDRTFVETLIFGGRLIGRELNEPREGLKFLRRALELMDAEGAVTKNDDELRSRIEGTKGLLKMALVIKDHDPLARSDLQSEALKHLTTATELSPTSAKTYYNLAYAQAECREIDASTLSIKSALELDPSNIHGWHLLTLLLTAKGKWHDAAKIADIGLESWDGDEDEIDQSINGAGDGTVILGDDTVTQKDFVVVEAVPPPVESTTTSDGTSPPTTASRPPLIGHHSRLIPMSSLVSSNPSLSSTKSERLEAVLQLRMTQTMIVERLDGHEAAMERQQELFAFFSARCGKVLPPTAAAGVPRSDTMDTNASSIAGVSTRGDTRRVDFGAVEKRSFEEPRDAERASVANGTLKSESGTAGSVVDLSLASPPPPPEVHVESPNGSPRPANGTDTPGSSSASSLENGSVRDHNRKQRFLPKHLLSPGSGRHQGLGRSASLSRLQIARQSASSLALTSLGQGNHSRRSISNASSIHSRSRRQSPTQSAHGSSYNAPSLPPTPPSPEQEPSGRTPRETRLLSSLWLMSAATFRRQAKMEQALGAIQEAEVLDATNPEVWVQLGLYHDLLSSPSLAISSLTKALVFDPLYIPAHVHLARLYLLLSSAQPSNLALAHGILNSLTQGAGWDCAEAWYFLARVCELQGGREERVRECLEFGKRLGEGRGVREVKGVVERWI